eukprot:TRINITY_DN1963_c2_g1_i3.p2 TRINITY_DN1963_c2_g1~~TRINITY_DN1963_c2_g1_i3.p2  ORF type:complete len:278 (+),score=47.41 TRINITY_DN1963_c2_g1_i3:936-1769(+)
MFQGPPELLTEDTGCPIFGSGILEHLEGQKRVMEFDPDSDLRCTVLPDFDDVREVEVAKESAPTPMRASQPATSIEELPEALPAALPGASVVVANPCSVPAAAPRPAAVMPQVPQMQYMPVMMPMQAPNVSSPFGYGAIPGYGGMPCQMVTTVAAVAPVAPIAPIQAQVPVATLCDPPTHKAGQRCAECIRTKGVGESRQRYRGCVVSYVSTTGFGFITCPELGRDVFLHRAQFRGIAVGQDVEFCIEYNKEGKPQARHVHPSGPVPRKDRKPVHTP